MIDARDSLPARVRAAAERAPGAAAVREGTRTISYGELARAMDGVAARLAAAGVRTGDRVGVLMPKSIGAVIAQLGAMRAGAAYVPVDPGAPMRRARRILADADVAALIAADAELAKRDGLLGTDESPSPRVVLSEGALHEASPASLPPMPGADDLAYVLYTSGSTGNPKGVMLTHRNALAFVLWAVEEVGVTAADVLSSHAPFHFDLSVFDLYAAFAAGATVALVPDALSYFPRPLAQWITAEKISIWYSVPSVLGKMATTRALDPPPPSLRSVLFAGEVFPLPGLRALRRALPNADLLNLYGPTETNVCTWHRVAGSIADDRREPLPIGIPCPYAECLVIDDTGAPASRGEVGELWVRGESTMRGYWNDAERTARSLVPDPRPATGGGGEPFYRTGDLVRWTEGGELAFLGRRDSMVKARGYRIELGDVEAALYEHAAVEDAAALVVPDESGAARLHAAVVLRAGATATALSLQRHCLEIVPRYMVPESILLLDELPRTTTGKVDRVSLVPQFTRTASPEAS